MRISRKKAKRLVQGMIRGLNKDIPELRNRRISANPDTLERRKKTPIR